MKITKREILASITIIAVMLLIGILISSKISQYQIDKNEIYNKALKIDNKEMFDYGIKTNIGNAFAYGVLEAIDTVTYPEIGGEYLYIKKEKERYTSHTRVVKRGKSTTTQTYWTWDHVSSEDKHSEKIKFMNTEFDYSKINIPSANYIDTIKESSHVRYKYYGCDTKYKGTIFTTLKDNTINNTDFYNNKTIKETVDYLEDGVGIILFWIFWFIVICSGLYGFYYLDNHWLEN